MTIKDKLPAGSPLGFGTAPLGNLFRAVPGAEATATVRAAREWGLGVNKIEPCELFLDLEEFAPDGFLLAGRYTLLDHIHAPNPYQPISGANCKTRS